MVLNSVLPNYLLSHIFSPRNLVARGCFYELRYGIERKMHLSLQSIISRLTRALRPHRGLTVLIFFVVLIHSGHHLIFQKILVERGLLYSPLLVNVDERQTTAAKANAVFRYGVISGDINLSEYRGAPYLAPPIPDLIMGYFSRMLGSVKAGFIAGDVIFPAVSFFLLYLLGLELTQRKTFAALFASAAFFTTRAFLFVPLLTHYHRAYIINSVFHLQTRLYFDRFEDPLLTAPFFFLALYLLLRTLTRDERWMPWLAGIAAGLLFYVYFYYMVYFFTALGVLAILLLVQRRKIEFKKIITVGGVGLALSSFYWINFLALTRLPAYADIVSRIGPEHGYAPFFSLVPVFAYMQHTALALMLYFLLRRESPGRAAFMAGLLLPVFVVYNFQIITGFNPQPDHWIKPRQFILTLSFLYLGFLLLKNHPRLFSAKYLLPAAVPLTLFLLWKGITTESEFVMTVSFGIIAGMALLGGAYIILKRRIPLTPLRFAGMLSLIVIAALFAKGFFIAKAFTEKNIAAATISRAEDASYRWLNANTPRGSVVGSLSFTTNLHLQLFTANKLFVPTGINTIASSQEILTRFMMLNRLWNVDARTFGSYFATAATFPPQDYDHHGIAHLFIAKYRTFVQGNDIFTNKGYAPAPWPDELHAETLAAYTAFTKKQDQPLPYRLDYLYVGPRELSLARDPFLQKSVLQPVYKKNNITIYAFRDR